MSREDLEQVASLFATDRELVETLVHEKKRDSVAGLTRTEVIDRMIEDYTFINRPVAVRGKSVACGPVRHNAARYDKVFRELEK